MSGVYKDQNDLIMDHKRDGQRIEGNRVSELKASKPEVNKNMC